MPRPKKFAVFDIDGTVIRWQLYHAVVDELAKTGHVPAAAYEKAQQARTRWKQRNGEEAFRDYELELVSAFRAALLGLPVSEFNKAARAVFTEHKDQVYKYTRELIRQLKQENYTLFAISASQKEIVDMVARYYGFDDCVGAEYEKNGDYFTGKFNMIYREKAAALKRLVTNHNATYSGSIGIGDSESDIAMLELVEHPIAFNPTKKLFEKAQTTGWKVVVERKNMIYELEPENGHYKLVNLNSSSRV